MMEQLSALIVDEGKWPAAALGMALLAVTFMLYRHRHASLPPRRRVLAAMTLFTAVTIGTMALGHFLAVSTKLAAGTLEGSIPLLYIIGIVPAVPSVMLFQHARALFASNQDYGQKTVVLNAWLAVTLLALGLPNLPLAVPALLNIAYHLHSRRVVGWVIVSMAAVINVGLLVGSLIFLASGQSFEQFSGMR